MIFFLVDGYRGDSLDEHGSTVIKKAQNMQERKESDFVVLLFGFIFYDLFLPWMPKENVIMEFENFNKSSIDIDPHFHQILMDLMLNPQYNWYERYTRHIKFQCPSSTNYHFYFWVKSVGYYYPSFLFWNNIVQDVFPNATFHRIRELTAKNVISTTGGSLITKDKLMKYMKEEEDNGEIIAIHLPFFYEKVDHTDFQPMKFNVENTINIIIKSSNIEESPVLQNGNIVAQGHYYRDPMFMKLVFEKINSILCRKN
uniref:Uncharacterized protein n=1 Tax=Clytia hemisphaerica TaxID=252671 RepID=A0A7M5WWI3_9CNID